MVAMDTKVPSFEDHVHVDSYANHMVVKVVPYVLGDNTEQVEDA